MFSLPPWELLPFFTPPTQALIALPFNANKVILSPDPTRVWISFSQFASGIGAGSSVVGPTNSTKYDGTNGNGFQVSTGTYPLIFTLWEHGPIVCGSWWGGAGNSMGNDITVITQSVYSWPGHAKSTKSILDTPDPGPRRPAVQLDRSPGVNGNRGVLDYWIKRMGRVFDITKWR
jgi:hypothetical protein